MVSKKLKIGYVTTEYNYSDKIFGGLASYLTKSTNILTNSGHSCVVFVLAKFNFSKVEDGVKIIGVKEQTHWLFLLLDISTFFIFHRGLLWLGKSFQMSLAIRKFLKTTELDVLQYCSAYGLGYFRIEDIPSCVRINSLKYVQNKALNINGFQDSIKAWVELQAIKKFNSIFAPSQGTLNELYKLSGQTGDVIRTPYIEPTEKSQISIKKLPDSFLLYIGSINRLKGFEQLASVIPKFLIERPEYKIVFIGPEQPINGKLPSQFFKGDPKVDDRCIFLGKMDKPELIKVLKQANALIIPSLSENLPNTGIEAICNGIPVVATKESNMGEFLIDDVHGFIYPAYDQDLLTKHLLSITKKSEMEMKQMKNNQTENAKQFSPENYSKSILDYYSEVIRKSLN